MITKVRFSAYVHVIKGFPSTEWTPGTGGVVEIVREDGGWLNFRLKGGATAIVYPPPGTVVMCDDDGSSTGPTVDTPAPARPIKPRR